MHFLASVTPFAKMAYKTLPRLAAAVRFLPIFLCSGNDVRFPPPNHLSNWSQRLDWLAKGIFGSLTALLIYIYTRRNRGLYVQAYIWWSVGNVCLRWTHTRTHICWHKDNVFVGEMKRKWPEKEKGKGKRKAEGCEMRAATHKSMQQNTSTRASAMQSRKMN